MPLRGGSYGEMWQGIIPTGPSSELLVRVLIRVFTVFSVDTCFCLHICLTFHCVPPITAIAGQNANLFNMRTHSQTARADSFRNSGQSVHSGHDSWHNSFQSGDGIKSEPGLILRNNPRFNLAGRRSNSNGSLGDLNNSFGELQAQDQFQNSYGEFNTGGGGGGANFHNSCVEFPSSFAEANNNIATPQEFHNSFAGFNSNNNNDFVVNSSDFHNSFGEIPYNHGGQDMAMPMHARSNPNTSGRSGHYRNANNYSPNPEQQHQQQQQYMLETDSVPLSISVPGAESGNNIQAEQFQLEFETDENSANRHRTRHPSDPNANALSNMQGVEMNNNLSIVDALENVGFATAGGDDPFEPVPLPDMEPEPIFQ